MSREYAEKRIREALVLAKGNAARARQQIIAWALQDQKLLLALAQPHLSGIVAHAVNRVVSIQSAAEEEVPDTVEPESDAFGSDLLRALSADDSAQFGQEANAAPVKRGAASRRHIDAIHQIATRTIKK